MTDNYFCYLARKESFITSSENNLDENENTLKRRSIDDIDIMQTKQISAMKNMNMTNTFPMRSQSLAVRKKKIHPDILSVEFKVSKTKSSAEISSDFAKDVTNRSKIKHSKTPRYENVKITVEKNDKSMRKTTGGVPNKPNYINKNKEELDKKQNEIKSQSEKIASDAQDKNGRHRALSRSNANKADTKDTKIYENISIKGNPLDVNNVFEQKKNYEISVNNNYNIIETNVENERDRADSVGSGSFVNVEILRSLVLQELETSLQNKLYKEEKVVKWCRKISNSINDRVRILTGDQQKVVVSTYIGSRNDLIENTTHVAMKCEKILNDDDFVTVAMQGYDLFAWVTLFIAKAN